MTALEPVKIPQAPPTLLPAMPKSLPEMLRYAAEIGSIIAENGGELTPELEAVFDQVALNVPVKVESYVVMTEQLATLETYFRERAQALEVVARGVKRAYTRIEIRIKEVAKELKLVEVVGTDRKFRLSRGKPNLMIDPALLPEEWWIDPPPAKKVPDTEGLRVALELGEKIPGAKLGETTTLRVYSNTETPAPKAVTKKKGKKA